MNVFQEAERIKQRIRDCRSKGQLTAVVTEERVAFRQIENASPDGATMAIQIKHLKTLKITEFPVTEGSAA